MALTRLIRSLLVAALATAGAAAGGAPPPATFHVLRYDVEVKPDIPHKTIAGQTTIHFQPDAAGLTELRFAKNNLTIDRASMDGIPIATRLDGEERVFDIPPELTGATARVVTVSYHGDGGKGLVFGDNWVYSGYHTCTWMICRDDPGEKVGFSIRVDVPATYKVVASGEATPGQAVWTETQSFSSYLFGFAAGEFTEVVTETDTAELRLLGVAETAESLKKKFQPSAAMLGFLEERAGIRLAHRSYTQVLVPGYEAQEKSSFAIIGKGYLDPILADPHEDWVIVHEMAHQWWGNQVTCKHWSEAWLNEGVVVFIVAAYKEKRWGMAAYERELGLAKEGRQRAIDAQFDVPLASSKTYPSLKIRRAIAYDKGAQFMNLLRRELGEKAFWEGLRAYTKLYRGKAVESRDFQAAMEKASGSNLSSLFEDWVYE